MRGSNADEIVNSLVAKPNYFSVDKEGGELQYSTMDNLDYNNMIDFINNFGKYRTFGFGSEKSYCTDYACQVLKAGGADLKDYSSIISTLMKEAEYIISKVAYPILALSPILELLKKSPKGENVRNDIMNANPSLPSGIIKNW